MSTSRSSLSIEDPLLAGARAEVVDLRRAGTWRIGVLLVAVAASLGFAELFVLPAWTGFLTVGGGMWGFGVFARLAAEAPPLMFPDEEPRPE